MPRGRAMKNPNGYESVVKLSGNRRKPFEVRVNTRMDERYYPAYDVLGRFFVREEALIALAEYDKNPFSISDRGMTFSQLYEKFYKNKYVQRQNLFQELHGLYEIRLQALQRTIRPYLQQIERR